MGPQEEVILIAIQATGEDREDIMRNVMAVLPHSGDPRPGMGLGTDSDFGIECWWIAEDDRSDGSDCDSAIFVHKGLQRFASKILAAFDFTGKGNITPMGRNDKNNFDGEQV
jgi:hypothetical protein